MKVCITGDVHHPVNKSWWNKNQVKFAHEYIDILDQYDAKATLFITGKCVETPENESFFRGVKTNRNIELGGHTYSALRPQFLHKIFLKLFSSYYGPRFYQRWDIERTLQSFKKYDINIRVWRTHAYAGDNTTYSLLSELGFMAVSDIRQICEPDVKEIEGLKHVIITMPPDEPIERYSHELREDWKKELWKILEHEIENKKDIVFNLHPKHMKMLDDFKTFHQVIHCFKEAKYSFMKISEFTRNFSTIVH